MATYTGEVNKFLTFWFQILCDAGLKHAARGSLKMQGAKTRQKIAIWAPSHNFVRLYLRN